MSKNIFDNLPTLSTPTLKELQDELDRYLSTDPELVTDVLMWWTERRSLTHQTHTQTHTQPMTHQVSGGYLWV